MNESIKNNIGVLAFVVFISFFSFVAYKIKDISFSSLNGVVDRIKSLLGTEDKQQVGGIDVVTVAVLLVLAVTLIQLLRLKK